MLFSEILNKPINVVSTTGSPASESTANNPPPVKGAVNTGGVVIPQNDPVNTPPKSTTPTTAQTLGTLLNYSGPNSPAPNSAASANTRTLLIILAVVAAAAAAALLIF